MWLKYQKLNHQEALQINYLKNLIKEKDKDIQNMVIFYKDKVLYSSVPS